MAESGSNSSSSVLSTSQVTVALSDPSMFRTLFITTNVGTLYEDPAQFLPNWSQQLAKLIVESNADFVAIHMQEVGGKSYKEGMAHVDNSIHTLRNVPSLARFDRARFHCFKDYNVLEKFTALGCLFLVRDTVDDHNVKTWNFRENQFETLSPRLRPTDRLDTLSVSPHLIEEKFDFTLFPTARKSRKGFQWSRWRLGQATFDLTNMHLFHDDSNLVIWNEQHDLYNQYSLQRIQATNKVLERCNVDDSVPSFFFGDFNFRLSIGDTLRHLLKDPSAEPQHIRDQNSKVTKLVFRDRSTSMTPAISEIHLVTPAPDTDNEKNPNRSGFGGTTGSAPINTPDRHVIKKGRLSMPASDENLAAQKSLTSPQLDVRAPTPVADGPIVKGPAHGLIPLVSNQGSGGSLLSVMSNNGSAGSLMGSSFLAIPTRVSRASSVGSSDKFPDETSEDGNSGVLAAFDLPTGGSTAQSGASASICSSADDFNQSSPPTVPILTEGYDASATLIEMEKKVFRIDARLQQAFTEGNGRALLQFDREPQGLNPRLVELPISFSPTYPFEEDCQRPAEYMPTRCPAWCDRVLMTSAAKRLVLEVEGVAPVYHSFSHDVCVGDHKPVFLSFAVLAVQWLTTAV